MAVDFKTFNKTAPLILNSKFPVLLRGRHGVGKSQVVYQVASSMRMPVVERRASQMTEGDLLGVPSPDGMNINGEQASKFRPFDWLVQACTEPVVLFFDEIDRATIEVRQGIFELTDSRKLAGWHLHEDTVICAAINGGDHGAQYQVGEMDPAELDRWATFDVEPTVEDWLDWAKDNTDELIWDFINQNRNHLEHLDDFEPNKIYPSRRSWDRLRSEEPKSRAVFSLTAAFVGFEAAVSLGDFIKNYRKIVTVEDILDKGDIAATAKFGINDHSALVEKMEASDTFKEKLTKKQLKNLAAYFKTLPSEVAMKLWYSLTSSGGDIQNTINLHPLIKEELVGMLTSVEDLDKDKDND
jgi:MoxR-like ATPase